MWSVQLRWAVMLLGTMPRREELKNRLLRIFNIVVSDSLLDELGASFPVTSASNLTDGEGETSSRINVFELLRSTLLVDTGSVLPEGFGKGGQSRALRQPHQLPAPPFPQELRAAITQRCTGRGGLLKDACRIFGVVSHLTDPTPHDCPPTQAHDGPAHPTVPQLNVVMVSRV
jgi:hypothetical protein